LHEIAEGHQFVGPGRENSRNRTTRYFAAKPFGTYPTGENFKPNWQMTQE
jgi:hypothetical protein